MAKKKIDVTLIDGYEEMSAEEKVAALEGFAVDVPDPDYTGYVKKDQFDKTAHDAAEWKRKYKSQLSDDEQARQTLIDQNEALNNELTTLRHEKAVSSYTTQFVAQGYDKDLAAETALAMADGDMDKVFVNQQKFIDQLRADKAAEEMKGMGRPDKTGSSPVVVSKEDFLKMPYEDKIQYKADHPDWKTQLK